jgi:hypothetical protein
MGWEGGMPISSLSSAATLLHCHIGNHVKADQYAAASLTVGDVANSFIDLTQAYILQVVSLEILIAGWRHWLCLE